MTTPTKRLRLILTPVNCGDGALVELDGRDITSHVQALHLTAEVGEMTRAVLTLTNLHVDVEAEAVIAFRAEPPPRPTP